MNFADWYTDTAEIYRVQAKTLGGLTTQERVQVATGVPCRIYHAGKAPISMTQTAAHVQQTDKLMCSTDVDLQAGDELIIRRGGGLGKTVQTLRAFAGQTALYFEPFGAVIPGLAHMEVPLLQQELVKGGQA